eukprot:TRINITY_DN4139_c0_g1_i2.p1 TRINITY_DN4139_c0_g1~~TRINITY_DN4139_c0_g1_i2.p1  ORF type:complete len:606 (+),score=193.59 TRINITY_DN4139_c0_g1_i2:43-1818(+)
MSDLPPIRSRSDRSALKNLKAKEKKLHAARGEMGHGREHGPRHARRRQHEHAHPHVKRTPAPAPAVELGAAAQMLASENWRVDVVAQHASAVVKVWAHMVEFDWEEPFKKADAETAVGTGFVLDASTVKRDQPLDDDADLLKHMYVVTNAHVVDSAVKVFVTSPSCGEERFDAVVCGVCFDIDLAVLRITDKRMPEPKARLRLGDSESVRIGESVLVLGHPLGVSNLKMTQGVISGREGGLFQTDSPLNPGNSGGPCLNRLGQVIGINVAIIEGAQNVGFSIPSFHLQQLFDALATRPPTAKVLFKPELGCSIHHTSPALLAFTGVEDTKNVTGVIITDVQEGFPMALAGVRPRDVLSTFDGHDVDCYGTCRVPWLESERVPLDSLVSLLTESSKPAIEFYRDGKLQTATLSFADPKRPGYPIASAVRTWHPPYETLGWETLFGLVIMPLTLNHVEMFHEEANATVLRSLTPVITDPAKQNKAALIVCSVLGGSAVSRVDVVKPGNLLSKINGREVSSLEQMREAFMEPEERGGRLFFSMETTDNKLVVLDIAEALNEEPELAEMYGFTISSLVVKLVEKLAEKVKKDAKK